VTSNGSKYAPLPGKIPGVAMNLGGHNLIIAPLNVNQLQHFQEQFENPPKTKNIAEEFEASLPLIVAAMQRNYPDLTPEDARGLIDIGNFREVVEAITSSSGLKKAGETAPASR
jgi:hypothetical protein